MPELDFLPPWYRELRRGRTWLIGQGIFLLLLGVVLSISALRPRVHARAAEGELAELRQQSQVSEAKVREYRLLQHTIDRARRHERMLSAAGLNVEPSRMLAALASLVPADTILTDIRLEVLDGNVTPVALTASTEAQPESSTARRLLVVMRGQAPGEQAVAQMLTALSQTPLFRHVNLAYAKDQTDTLGRSYREFELNFQIDLSPQMETPKPDQTVNAQ